MADADHAPSDELFSLYRAWAEGGSGLIITGNVMINARAMTGRPVLCWKTTAPLPASKTTLRR